MSAKATFWAWEQELNHTLKIVLLSLANYSNENDESWHGMESLSKSCGLSKRTVIRSVQSLEKSGHVTVTKRKKTDILNDTNLYRLNIKASAYSRPNTDPVEPHLVTESHQGSDRESLGVVTESHQGSDRESPKPKSKSKIETKKDASLIDGLPEWIDKDLFNEYLDTRKKLKAVNSKRAITTLINKLKEIEKSSVGAGNSALEEANVNSWKSVYPPKNDTYKGQTTLHSSGMRTIKDF